MRYWESHREQVRPITEITMFINELTIANPSKLASKIQDQIPEVTALYWPPKSIFFFFFAGNLRKNIRFSGGHMKALSYGLMFQSGTVPWGPFLPSPHSPGACSLLFSLSLLCQVSPCVIFLQVSSLRQRPHVSTLSPLSNSIYSDEQTWLDLHF